MSAKDEILVINQRIAAIEKRLFELRAKIIKTDKKIHSLETDELPLAQDRIDICKKAFDDIKAADIIPLEDWKYSKSILINEIDTLKEIQSNIKTYKLDKAAMEEAIPQLEKIKQDSLNEISKNYGQIKEFPRKSH